MPCQAEAPEVALAAVPALAQLFSAPADQASATGQTKQPSAGATSWAQSASLPADAAALQLEAMQVLLLLLPLPMPQVWYVIQSSLYMPMRQLQIIHTFPIPVLLPFALLHCFIFIWLLLGVTNSIACLICFYLPLFSCAKGHNYHASTKLKQVRSDLCESLFNWLQAQEAASGLSADAARSGEGWAGDIRTGLFMVLASRVGQQQRHSALRLAAALLELVQPRWLLGPVHAVSHVLLSVFYCHGAGLLQ